MKVCNQITRDSRFARIRILRGRAAFSLVEVTLAIGIVSFTMLAILGLLPTGLQTLRDANREAVETGIERQLRASIAQLEPSDFAALTGDMFFDYDGSPKPSASDAFYAVSFEVPPGVPNAFPGQPTDLTSAARQVVVSLRYPAYAPSANQEVERFTILAANQQNRAASNSP